MKATLLTLCFLLGLKGFSQADSVAYSPDFLLYEGLYLTYQDFRHNWPIPKEKITTQINKDQLDFFSKLIENDKIEFIERDGKKDTVKANEVWGYCQNNIIYINLNKSFFRIPVFGNISYFLATVEVNAYTPGYNVFINGNVPTGTMGRVMELREFLWNFYTGELFQFSIEKLEELLKSDNAIYTEFMALSRKKKKESAAKYIRMYNETHPVYFPKN